MVLRCLLRTCGILGYGLNGDEDRLVVVIAAEVPSESSEELEPELKGPQATEASAFDWLPALPSLWGQAKGGLCTQALLAVLLAAGRAWGSLSFRQLQLRMQAALQRSGVENATVTLRCSQDLLESRSGRGDRGDRGGIGVALGPFSEARALLIGICYEEDVKLEGSWNDVQDMRSWLLREGIVPEQGLRILSDVSEHVPSRRNILAHLRWLLSGDEQSSEAPCEGPCGSCGHEVSPPLQLFLLFAGHGDHAELLPSDWQEAGPITEREISALVDDLLPSGARLTCVFDCCDSSQMFRSLLRYRI